MKNNPLYEALLLLLDKKNLTQPQIENAISEIINEEIAIEQAAAFLTAMKMKGVTASEILFAANFMRSLANKFDLNDGNAVDIVGTGGDGASLFNVSTAAAFVCATAGVKVAKHGNYGFSSNSGSANLLESFGINLHMNSEQVQKCIEHIGVGFIFAPIFHPAMKQLANIRKNLRFKTFFNLLGPLLNPANVKKLVVGVYEKDLCAVLANVLQSLGATHFMVVHSEDGLDEISPVKKTYVMEMKHGQLSEYFIDPTRFNMNYTDFSDITVSNSNESVAIVKKALQGTSHNPYVEKALAIIALNAGAGIYLSVLEKDYESSVRHALSVIKSGKALAKMYKLAQYSQQFS